MDYFLGFHIHADSLAGMAIALVLSAVLSGLIGLERELHGHPAGLRTHILVCVGSTLITLVSVHVGGPAQRGDPGRIAAQIVSGIGFLGAGAIIREGASVKGLTTAASVWTTAGIGIAVGVGPFYGELALIATIIVLTTLWLLNKIEDKLAVATRRTQRLEVQLHDGDKPTTRVLACIVKHDVFVQGVEHEAGGGGHIHRMVLYIRPPKGFDRQAFLADLADEPGVLAVSL